MILGSTEGTRDGPCDGSRDGVDDGPDRDDGPELGEDDKGRLLGVGNKLGPRVGACDRSTDGVDEGRDDGSNDLVVLGDEDGTPLWDSGDRDGP